MAVDAGLDQPVGGLRRQHHVSRCGCRCSSARRRPDSPRRCRCRRGRRPRGPRRSGRAPRAGGTPRATSGWNSASVTQTSGFLASIGSGMMLKSPAMTSGSSLRQLGARPVLEALHARRACRRIFPSRSDCRSACRPRRRAPRRPSVETRPVMKRACSSPSRAGKPLLHILERMLREERDAVEALLAVDGDVVAELLDRLGRKARRRRS